MNTAVLILGSNSGDRETILKKATKHLSTTEISIKKVSSVYESEPWGYSDTTWFLNVGVVVETSLNAKELLEFVLDVETRLGRVRTGSDLEGGYTSRTIDIDIIFFNDIPVNCVNLQIPHALMHQRKFVLEPLKEIIPTYNHPVFNKTVEQLYDSCEDNSAVRFFKSLTFNNEQ